MKGAIIAGGVEWGCLGQDGEASSFIRRIDELNWRSPVALVARTTSAQFSDAFERVDVRFGAGALTENSHLESEIKQGDFALQQATPMLRRPPVTDAHNRAVRQSCNSGGSVGNIAWREPYVGSVVLEGGSIPFQFTFTDIVPGTCIDITIWEDITGGWGTQVSHLTRAPLTDELRLSDWWNIYVHCYKLWGSIRLNCDPAFLDFAKCLSNRYPKGLVLVWT